MEDKDFTIAGELNVLGLCLNTSLFVASGNQLSLSDIETTQIVRHKIQIERIIRKAKT